MSNDKFKVLVLHPSLSDVEKCVKIANLQNKKAGPFEMSLFLGDVFNGSENGTYDSLKPDMPVYLMAGQQQGIATEKMDKNFNCLKEMGIYKLVNGLRIGYICKDLKNYTTDQIAEKFSSQEVDILMTYQWPEAIAHEEKLLLCGDKRLDCLIHTLRPRYWLACGNEKGKFFERKPYRIGNRVTRFISLATMAEGRWWYAFQIGLDEGDISKLSIGPAPVVEPATQTGKKRLLETDLSVDIHPKRKDPAFKSAVHVTPDNCFLCLSNPKFELHMVISVADMSYLTVSKGPLTLKKGLGFSGHGMIVPIEHYPTLRSYVHDKDSAMKVEDSPLVHEITKFQESLAKMFRSLGEYSVIFWEISRKRSIHFHSQFVPVSDRIIPLFEKALSGQIEYDRRYHPVPLEFTKFDTAGNVSELNTTINTEDYVLFTLYDKVGVSKYLIKLGNDDDRFFDAQFPRKVLAVMLNLKNRIRWNQCIETKEEESIQKAAFREHYARFDIMKKESLVSKEGDAK